MKKQKIFSLLTVLMILTAIGGQFALPTKVASASISCESFSCDFGNPELFIEKKMKNLETQETNFSDIVNAEPNQRLAVQIEIENIGDAEAKDLFVRDILPSKLIYVSGSTKVDGVSIGDGITGNGISLDSLMDGDATTIRFEVKTAAESEFTPNIATTLQNIAFANAEDADEVSDNAKVIVTRQQANRDFSIRKTLRDLTAGQISFLNDVAVQNNDRLIFKIEIQNTGDEALENLFVRDSLPSGLSFISGTVRINDVTGSDSLIGGGINLGSLGINQTKAITFEATVNVGNFSGTQTLTNTAFARADQVSEKSDTASAVVSAQVNNPNLNISKSVRNLSEGQASFSESVNADNADQVQFQIKITNNGNTTLSNIFVRDNLPSGLSYINGSTRVDGLFVSDGLVSGGINIGSLNSGSIRTVVFEATVNTFNISGSQTLTNIAFARADQVSEKSDSASVFVSQQAAGNLNITKFVKNLTSGQGGLVTSINAAPGDRVQFAIKISAFNQSINNVQVRDSLPSGLNFVSGSARQDGNFLSDSLVSGGVNLGTIFAGQTKTIVFEAIVDSSINTSRTLTNTAFTSGDNVSTQSASAQVVVNPAQTPAVFTKKVANLTSPNGSDFSNQAAVGDVLQYTLSFTNTTNTVLQNVQIFDVLPPNTSFRSASNNGSLNTNNNEISWNIGALGVNSSVIVTYQVNVNTGPAAGFTIPNTALLRADNMPSVISNEVITTVASSLKGVKAVTGSNDLPRNAAIAGLITLWGIFLIYLLSEYVPSLKNLRFKLALWQIRRREKIV